MKSPKKPADLGPAGRQLWAEIEAEFDIAAVRPTLTELCRTADRLAEIRAAYLGEGGASGSRAEKHIGSECKILNQYRQLSRALGMHDANKGATRA